MIQKSYFITYLIPPLTALGTGVDFLTLRDGYNILNFCRIFNQ